MNIILFDPPDTQFLYPFAYTQPVAMIRAGMFTNAERWHNVTGLPVFFHTRQYLQNNGPHVTADDIWVDASVIPYNTPLLNLLLNLKPGEALIQQGNLIGGRCPESKDEHGGVSQHSFKRLLSFQDAIKKITYAWQLFQWSEEMIRLDYPFVIKEKKSVAPSVTNSIIQADNVFIDEGVQMEHCIINAGAGPVYIGRNVTVMEGTFIKGPVVLDEGTVVKAGAKIYAGTNAGPYCTIGGEIKNSVLMGYSNKAHDGYLGDSVIGYWCNLGAGTSNSNLRNDAGEVKLKLDDYTILPVGRKCGLLMGDYTRCAINTSFNTGTFAGIAGNIFGGGLTPKYMPNFTWGYNEKYDLEKCITHIDNWKKLKNQVIQQTEIDILTHLYKN